MNKSSMLIVYGLMATMGMGGKPHDPAINEYVKTTIAMLPEDKREYWSKRIYSLRRDEDRMERCRALRKHFTEE